MLGMVGNSPINKYLILSIVILAVGIPTAYAITITLSANPVIINGILDLMNNRITNVGTPTLSSDAATKGYADSVVADPSLFLKTYQIISPSPSLNPGATITLEPSCQSGDIATGGGYFTSIFQFADQPRFILRNFGIPASSTEPPTAWRVTVHNPGPLTIAMNAYVVCLDITP